MLGAEAKCSVADTRCSYTPGSPAGEEDTEHPVGFSLLSLLHCGWWLQWRLVKVDHSHKIDGPFVDPNSTQQRTIGTEIINCSCYLWPCGDNAFGELLTIGPGSPTLTYSYVVKVIGPGSPTLTYSYVVKVIGPGSPTLTYSYVVQVIGPGSPALTYSYVVQVIGPGSPTLTYSYVVQVLEQRV